MSELEHIEGPADCEHDNTEQIIEELSVAGELYANRNGTPLTRCTYNSFGKRKVVIVPFHSEEEARFIAEGVIAKYKIKQMEIDIVQ